ncbi:hypothetical protein SAMN04489711_1422 [Paracidovorax wautersii]|uniref:Uncharacterized protein n=2 Tax=Paracidovorax wautersii TaxID=1177982 RepID=A0A1I2I118_9BURK|nr:hypothetical protein SAMN04489711_1422 [Paracidovorax wautersii]
MGVTWNAIIEWPVEDVLATIKHAGLKLHEAYVRYFTSRVSCVFCIMSSLEDMIASAHCEANQDVYRVMVELEADSTFGFQGNRWLADVAPHLLSPELLERVAEAKRSAQFRMEAEAQLIASVRQRVSWHLGLNAKYLTADAVIARYAELLAMKALKEAKTKAKATKAKRTKGLSKSTESVA